MDYPKTVLDIVRQAVSRHPDDLDKSVEEAWEEIASLPDYETYYELFISRAVRELIHNVRYENNKIIRGGGTPKKTLQPSERAGRVKMWESKGVIAAYAAVYTYAMNGMMLGKMTGMDLQDARSREVELRNGHEFNVKLCAELMKKVKDKQTVEQVYKATALERLFHRLRNAS